MFYTREQLQKLFNFKSLGDNVLISDKASIYNSSNISIGSNVRIDDFCILSPCGNLNIGSYIHISCYASLIGKGDIVLEDFVGISGRVSIYSSNDDYTGVALTNPTVPLEFRKVTDGDVILKKHTIVGAGSIILPNVVLGEGTSVHALSLIYKNCVPFGVYAGVPAKFIRERKKDLLAQEEKFYSLNSR